MRHDTFRQMSDSDSNMRDASDASVLGGVADSFDMYGCSDVSNDGADMSMCDSWRLIHLTEASDPFRRYDE